MRFDPIQWLVMLVFGTPVVLALGYVCWILISVVYLGASSCPPTACQ
jgi:hypothetical protein